ncbi:hypothetical protein [Aliarcobacter cryaerophilus]|uniref:hypothetical protein n=1 Tax=Aliarcobacter cryaerophilus TaxID=28198 RepID=UPI00082C7513|nr:hypothetical protein [Aliarcobacter cryaerophilus]
MNIETEQENLRLGEHILNYGSDNLIFLIIFSITILYIISYKYKELSFQYIKIIVAITTICFTAKFSYIFFIQEQNFSISKEIREFELKKIENSNNEYKEQININIKYLEEENEKMNDSMNLVTKTIEGITYIGIFGLMLLFCSEIFSKIIKYILNISTKKNKKSFVDWREKRKKNFYYNLKLNLKR